MNTEDWDGMIAQSKLDLNATRTKTAQEYGSYKRKQGYFTVFELIAIHEEKILQENRRTKEIADRDAFFDKQ